MALASPDRSRGACGPEGRSLCGNSLSEDCRPWRGSHSGDLATARPLCTSEARNTGCMFRLKQLIKRVLI